MGYTYEISLVIVSAETHNKRFFVVVFYFQHSINQEMLTLMGKQPLTP